ncbi:MAG: SOS response-associated peptidase [Gammaproteobacteria bacterium]|nr:SOS response-associated peptidase [Gammaproteobacteria bacterium]
MCGRFAFYSPGEATAALFGVNTAFAVEPRYNIAPTQNIAAIRQDESGERELTMLRWGLVPSWAKDPAIGNRMINARAETVAEKPSYRAAFRKRRCLVLADGFYEWHTEAGSKIPYYFSMANAAPFAFAGLWEAWQSKTSDDSVQSTTLITTAANDFVLPVHHRMPLVLDIASADRWMAGDDEVIEDITKNAPRMRVWPVDRRVNNARNEGAELIEAVADARES